MKTIQKIVLGLYLSLGLTAFLQAALATQNMATKTALDLATLLVGPSAVISNATFTGHPDALGVFTGGEGILNANRLPPNTFACCSPGCLPDLCPPSGCEFPVYTPFAEGVVLSTGSIARVVGPNKAENTSTDLGQPGDLQLESILDCPGGGVPCTLDAAILEFDITPSNSTLLFQYVFASDEYNEFTPMARTPSFNDAFAFFVNGVNVGVLASGVEVSINTVNTSSNRCQYMNNANFSTNEPAPAYQAPGLPLLDIEMDGLTVVLTAQAALTPGVPNHIKLVIADFRDRNYDSAVFLKAGSFIIASPTPSPTPTSTISPTFTSSPTISPTHSITPTFSISPTFSHSPTITQTFTVSPTYSVSPTITVTFSHSPTFTPSPTATPTGTFTVSPTATPSFSITPTFTISPTRTVSPTNSPSPTVTPTPTATPPNLCLHLPSPNPNPSTGSGTWLPFFLCADAEVSIDVYTIAGEKVRHFDVGSKSQGTHETFWDNKNNAGRVVATGIYIYRVGAVDRFGVNFSDFRKTAVLR